MDLQQFLDLYAPLTTHNHLRQFIPIDRTPTHALAMASYNDTKDATYWKRIVDKGSQQLTKTLLKYLGLVFNNVSIPIPQWIRSHYWHDGVHVWKPGADSCYGIVIVDDKGDAVDYSPAN
jgi:hypothetical protein